MDGRGGRDPPRDPVRNGQEPVAPRARAVPQLRQAPGDSARPRRSGGRAMSHRRVLDEFAQQTAPKPETLARLQERLAVDTAGSFLRRRSRVLPVLVVAAAAAAAVLTVALWPSATPVATVAPSAPMAVPLRSDDWV